MYNIGLELAPHKTILIHFNKQNIETKATVINVGETIIKCSEYLRYLGVILDHQLNFNRHVEAVKNKWLLAMNLIKYLRGIWWGADPNTLLILYKSYIRSIIDYACFIYLPTQEKGIEKLEKIQYAAFRYALGYRISTPTNILLAESKLPYIRDRTSYLCYNYLIKVLSNTGLIVNKIIHKIYKNKLNSIKKQRLIVNTIMDIIPLTENLEVNNQYNLYLYSFETIIANINYDGSPGREIRQSKNPNDLIDKFIKKEDAIAIFTDGSKTKTRKSVGTSCICVSLDSSITCSLPCETSIFTAENVAINDAMNFALENCDRNIVIFTDSESTLKKLTSNKISIKTNKIIYEIKKKVDEFSQRTKNSSKVKVVWIPSHSEIRENDKTDELAKIATEKSFTQESQDTLVPFTDLREKFAKITKMRSNNTMVELGQIKGIEYFQYYFSNQSKPWFSNLKLDRKTIVMVNCCRKHYQLAHSLARINIVESSQCTCGYKKQDLDHVLWQCPLYENKRPEFLEKLRKEQIYLPACARLLLSKLTTRIRKALSNFLNKCELTI